MVSKTNKVVSIQTHLPQCAGPAPGCCLQKGLANPDLRVDHPWILQFQAGYVAANEGFLSHCLLDSS